MASRLDFSQIRSLYIGTSPNTTVDTNNLIVSGNVGIGTTSPAVALHVDASGGGIVRVSRIGAGAGVLQMEADGTNGTLAATNAMIFNTNSSERLRITSAGNVGIGTTSPSSLLTVNGLSANTESGQIRIIKTGANEQTLHIGYNTTSDYAYLNAYKAGLGYKPISLNPDGGNVGIGTTSPVSTNLSGSLTIYKSYNGDTASVPSITAQTYYENQSGLYLFGRNSSLTLVGANGENNEIVFANASSKAYAKIGTSNGTTSAGGDMYFNTGGNAEAMRITASGNVGINTTSPSDFLHIRTGIGWGARITYTGDNSYLRFSSNQIAAFNSSNNGTDLYFNHNAAGNILFSGTGNVGIGTTAPGAPLHVYKSDTYSAIVSRADWNSSVPTKLALGKQYGVLAFISTDLVETTTDTSYIALNYKSGLTTFAEGLRVYNNGNVGIGTTSPNRALTVNGIIGVTNGTANTQQLVLSTDSNGSYISSSYIGTSSYVPLVFETSGTEKMRITNAGNVGIGTTSPKQKLDVAGAGGKIAITNTGTTDYSELMFYEGASIKADIWVNGSAQTDYAGANSMNIWQGSNAPIVFYTNGTNERMRITGAGNVGIGTSAPDTPLSSARGIVINSGASNDVQIRMQNNTTGSAGSDGGLLSISGSQMYLWNYEASNLIFGTNNSERMRIDSSGNIGIGTTSISYRVDISGDARILSGSLGVGVAPNATDGRIDASNDIVAYSTSDQRLKENVTPIENALEKVKTLTGVEFDWKEETAHVHGYHGHDVGIIAQDVQAVLPEAVRTNDSGYLSVRYEKMIALLIEANKELAARVEELEKKLK